MTRLVLPQVLVGILLLLEYTTRLEALKSSSKGVRGMPSSSASTQLKNVGFAATNTFRILQQYNDKNDKNKDDEEVVAAEEEEEDNNDQDDDKQNSDKEEETEPPVEAEEEVPQKGGEEEVEPTLDDNGNQEQGDEGYPEETSDPKDTQPEVEAAEEELDETETSPPEATETMAPESDVTPPNGTDVLTEVSTVPLAPFVIEIDYDVPVEQDPGIEAYLEEEMKKTFSNLLDIELEFSGVTAGARRTRRRLAIQVLSYSGVATFNGPPTESETIVQTTQAGILGDEEAVAAVIAESLGVKSVTVTSFAVEATPATKAPEENTNNGGQLNQMTLTIVIVAACLAGLALIFVGYKFFCGAEPPPPKAPVKQSSRAAPAPTHLTLATELAGATGGPEALNATHETDAASLNTDDQVHEEFAQNMEKHSFGSAWQQQQQQQEQPVHVQASVMRGTLIEKKEIDPFDAPDDEGKTKLRQMNWELDTLSSDVQTATDKARSLELEMELHRLAASVKAAKEKTQRILNEANARKA